VTEPKFVELLPALPRQPPAEPADVCQAGRTVLLGGRWATPCAEQSAHDCDLRDGSSARLCEKHRGQMYDAGLLEEGLILQDPEVDRRPWQQYFGRSKIGAHVFVDQQDAVEDVVRGYLFPPGYGAHAFLDGGFIRFKGVYQAQRRWVVGPLALQFVCHLLGSTAPPLGRKRTDLPSFAELQETIWWQLEDPSRLERQIDVVQSPVGRDLRELATEVAALTADLLLPRLSSEGRRTTRSVREAIPGPDGTAVWLLRNRGSGHAFVCETTRIDSRFYEDRQDRLVVIGRENDLTIRIGEQLRHKEAEPVSLSHYGAAGVLELFEARLGGLVGRRDDVVGLVSLDPETDGDVGTHQAAAGFPASWLYSDGSGTGTLSWSVQWRAHHLRVRIVDETDVHAWESARNAFGCAAPGCNQIRDRHSDCCSDCGAGARVFGFSDTWLRVPEPSRLLERSGIGHGGIRTVHVDECRRCGASEFDLGAALPPMGAGSVWLTCMRCGGIERAVTLPEWQLGVTPTEFEQHTERACAEALWNAVAAASTLDPTRERPDLHIYGPNVSVAPFGAQLYDATVRVDTINRLLLLEVRRPAGREGVTERNVVCDLRNEWTYERSLESIRRIRTQLPDLAELMALLAGCERLARQTTAGWQW
jgi:hypothetical protein